MHKINKKFKIILVILVIISGMIAYYIYFANSKMYEEFENSENTKELIPYEEEVSNIENNNTNQEENTKEENLIIVHITGAVQNWGIVELPQNSRIINAVEAAGGFTEDADTSKINLAYIIEDGMKITVPSINDKDLESGESYYVSTDSGDTVESSTEKSTSTDTKTVLININSATQTELEQLPGIGPSTALKIINYRNENGKFKSIEDLKNVSGIGDSKFESVKDLICI